MPSPPSFVPGAFDAAVAAAWALVVTATLGVLAGTLLGERALFGLSPDRFRQLVAALIGVLGVWLLFPH